MASVDALANREINIIVAHEVECSVFLPTLWALTLASLTTSLVA